MGELNKTIREIIFPLNFHMVYVTKTFEMVSYCAYFCLIYQMKSGKDRLVMFMIVKNDLSVAYLLIYIREV